jgi:hypothetical protein
MHYVSPPLETTGKDDAMLRITVARYQDDRTTLGTAKA